MVYSINVDPNWWLFLHAPMHTFAYTQNTLFSPISNARYFLFLWPIWCLQSGKYCIAIGFFSVFLARYIQIAWTVCERELWNCMRKSVARGRFKLGKYLIPAVRVFPVKTFRFGDKIEWKLDRSMLMANAYTFPYAHNAYARRLHSNYL